MVNKDYIIPALGGRLGNNMFMVANAYARALDYNKQMVIAKSQVMYEGNDYSQNIFRKFEFIESFVDNKNCNPGTPSDDKHTIYMGYFQNEQYFEKYSENIKCMFSPPLDFIKKIQTEIPVIFEKKVTVINVRRGDYLIYLDYHPTVSPEYILKALDQIPTTEHILVASDDIPWCKEHLNLPEAIYLEGWRSHEQLWIMAMCHNFVISNSSFSWWAAYLSRYTEKIVIAPETWFGPSAPQDWKYIYCKGWTILPSYFNNGLIQPK